MNERDKNKKQLFVSLGFHFFSSHTNIEKKTNEVRKKYMDMKLNAAYLFSVIKQRTIVIKKKNNLCPKLVVLNMILFKIRSLPFQQTNKYSKPNCTWSHHLNNFFNLYQNVKKQINSQSSFLNLFSITLVGNILLFKYFCPCITAPIHMLNTTIYKALLCEYFTW